MALAAAAAAAVPAVRLFSSPSSPAAARPRISLPAPIITRNSRLYSHSPATRTLSVENPKFRLHSAVVEEAATASVGGADDTQKVEGDGEGSQRLKLYVANLPWSLSAADIESLFGQCGTVKDVDIIRQRDGKSRGFAFITMGSEEEAQAAVDKFDSHEVNERIIRVEYAKSFKKPTPPPPVEVASRETRHLIFATNLAWKVRSGNLRDFFSASFKPVSARVVFDSPSGKSAGYGFVSFATQEEAEAAVAELNGKELLGRPLRLKISENKGDKSESEQEPAGNTEAQVEAA